MKSTICLLFSVLSVNAFAKDMYTYDDSRFPAICPELHDEYFSMLSTKVLPAVNEGDGTKAIELLSKASEVFSGLSICASAMFDKNHQSRYMNSEYYGNLTGKIMLAGLMLALDAATGDANKVRCGEGAKFFKEAEQMMVPNTALHWTATSPPLCGGH